MFQEPAFLARVDSMSAAEVGDPRRGHFIGCRNQRVGPAERDPAVPLRGRVSL
jgi:hypothetical protein